MLLSLSTVAALVLLPGPTIDFRQRVVPVTRLCIPVATESDGAGALRIVLQGTPVAAALAVGTPLFVLLYAPLAALGRAAEAPPAAALVASTLLYAAVATLGDGTAAQPLLETVAVSVGCSAGLLALGEGAEAETAEDEPRSTALDDWDRRLKDRQRK